MLDPNRILDADMRGPLAEWICKQHWYGGYLIPEKELAHGVARVDMLALCTDHMRCFEIKSDGDSLGKRLTSQLIEYACVGRTYLVITEKHEEAWRTQHRRAAHWRQTGMGCIVMVKVDGMVKVRGVTDPQMFNSYLAPRHMLNMLWKSEILSLLKKYSLSPKGAAKKRKEELAEVLADGLGLASVQKVVIGALQKRYAKCKTT